MLRFSAPAIRARRPDVLPKLRHARTQGYGGRSGSQGVDAARGVALVRAVSVRRARDQRCIAGSSVRTAQEGLQPAVPGRAPVRILDSGIAAGYRFRQAGVRAGGPPGDWAGSAPADGGHDRDLLSRGRRSDLRERVRRRAAALQRAFSVQDLRDGVRHSGADPVQLQFPGGGVPALPGLRQYDRFRHEPRDPGRLALAGRGRGRSVDEAKVSLLAGQLQEKPQQGAHERAGLRSDRRGARNAGRIHPTLLRSPGEQEVQDARARVSEPLSRLRAVPGVQRRAFAQGSALRAGERQEPGRCGAHEHRRGAGFFPVAGTQPGRDGDRREDPGGDPAAAEVPQRCGPGISHAGPPGEHAVGRRGAAHPAGHVAGLAPGGRLLRAGRAFHRAAQPRYRTADPHSGGTARSGQHDRGGGARSRRDARGRPHRGPGSGRRASTAERSSSKALWPR